MDFLTMMTSSNENVFHVTGPLCGEFTGPRWIPRTKASDAEFDVFFDLCLNKRLSKQSWGWWFETLSRPLWRHSNDTLRTEQDALNISSDNFKYRFWIAKLGHITSLHLLRVVTRMVQEMAWHRPSDKPLSVLMISKCTGAHIRY